MRRLEYATLFSANQSCALRTEDVILHRRARAKPSYNHIPTSGPYNGDTREAGYTLAASHPPLSTCPYLSAARYAECLNHITQPLAKTERVYALLAFIKLLPYSRSFEKSTSRQNADSNASIPRAFTLYAYHIHSKHHYCMANNAGRSLAAYPEIRRIAVRVSSLSGPFTSQT